MFEHLCEYLQRKFLFCFPDGQFVCSCPLRGTGSGELLHSRQWLFNEALVCEFSGTGQFLISNQSVLSTWLLRMYIMPLWCVCEAELVWAREVKARNCLSSSLRRPQDVAVRFERELWLKGQSLLPSCWDSSLGWLAAGQEVPVLHGKCVLRVRGRMGFSEQELIVRMQLYVAVKLTLIHSCAIFCIGA